MTPKKNLLTAAALALGVGFAGCDRSEPASEKPATLAPTASALAPAKAATVGAKKFSIDQASSKVDFVMEAPKEKIVGHVAGASTGTLQVDFMDLTKTTGLIQVDITGIDLFQAKADDSGKLGPETRSEPQNKHARTWLEISEDAPADMRKANALVQFSIKSIVVKGEKDLTKLTGAERKVTLEATGDFLLHGHKTEKVAELEATFKFDGDKPMSVTIKSVKPFGVNLVEHDVKPREAFGKLALKALAGLSSKVAQDAMVSLELTAKAGS